MLNSKDMALVRTCKSFITKSSSYRITGKEKSSDIKNLKKIGNENN